ncbi:MAG: diguanylate cyclase [Aquificaceae bacterium]
MDYSAFDLIPKPILVVDREYKVIFANKKAKEVYGKWEGTCHEISHGFPRPCHDYEGYPCPVKLIQDQGIQGSGVIHIHKTKGENRIFYVLAQYYPEEDVYVELHIDLEDVYENLRSYYVQSPLNLFFEGPVVFFHWRKEEGWPVEFVSPNVEKLLGYTADDFISGRVSYAELVHPDDIERVAQEVQYHTENKSPSWTHEDYRLKRKDGRYIWVLDYTIPLLSSNGDIVGYYGYLMDITERYEKEELFHLLAETNPNAVLIYDFHNNRILYANKSAAKLTGRSLEELLNLEDPLELIHPDDRHKAIEIVNKRKQGYKEPVSYYTRIKKDGSLKYVKLTSVVTKYKGQDVSFVTLTDITKEIKRERKYKKLATTDPLTKVYNRYVLFSSLEHLIEYAERYGETFSLIIFDIDNFKVLNDTYGHLVGDGVLRSIAKGVKRVIRRSDIFGRYGGEEFLLILPKAKDPYPVAEKIKRLIESMDFEKGIKVTISVGGTVYKKGDTVDSMIRRADEALYLAKQYGKNQTIIL